jgi:sarcosine oxidase subunit gamma
MTNNPSSQQRRSALYRRHLALGAQFELRGKALCIAQYAEQAHQTEQQQARCLGLCDLSTMPRTGFKGSTAIDWLKTQSVVLPSAINTTAEQPSGSLCAQLSHQEVLLLSDLRCQSEDIARLSQPIDNLAEDSFQQTYELPRADSHCWLAITGSEAARMMAKLCAVDLHTDKFRNGCMAQTAVAKLNSIIIRQDLSDTLCFYLLCDATCVEYIWDCLLDAMNEFAGQAIGIDALLQLQVKN